VHAEYEHGDWADELNESVGKLLEEHQSLFSGFGTVSLSPLRPRRAIGQLRRAAELGLAGINIQPVFFGIPINDRRLYPLFATAEEEGLVVAIHTGINYSTHSPMSLEHPLLLDEVACDFPELRLVACHGGWPWIAEMVAVARRHPHVYVDFGGLAPKYVGLEGSGWETMFRLMNSVLANQVLFATDWPVFTMERALREWAEVGLSDETLAKLFSSNVGRLLERAAGVATPR
jgi:predicted TIM-barrel fold metal-dependent hydrolase